METADALDAITELRKLAGASGFYRIRVGDYRIGLSISDSAIECVRCEAREWLIEHYLDQLDPEERLKGLDPAFIEAWLDKQRKDH